MPPFCDTHQVYWRKGACPHCVEEDVTGFPPNAGHFETPLPDMLLSANGRIAALEAQVRRYDEGIAAAELAIAKDSAAGVDAVTVRGVQEVLSGIGRYGSCAMRGRHMDVLLSDWERWAR